MGLLRQRTAAPVTFTDNIVPMDAGAGSGVGRLQKAQQAEVGDISGHLTEAEIAAIGADVVADWERDREANKEWRKKAENALDAAAQEDAEEKTYPWVGAANVQYPLLTISGVQFNARAYPAIVKGDEAIKVKTFGRDRGGRKAKRAERVKDFLNYQLFYVAKGWEDDTDAMLLKLPVVGQHFRKVWWDPLKRRPCVDSVSALRLTIPPDATSLEEAPRITHDYDLYPHQIETLMRGGHFLRAKDLVPDGDDTQASRLILEQHRMMDLDEDGLEEPYIVTVDHASAQVLRIEQAFDEEDISYADDGRDVLSIERWCPFVSYPFIPDPKGRAYAIGFGHLLKQVMAVIDTNINMLLDAGHAQVAGGGFISAEVRLQGAGQNAGALRFQPGEYKTVGSLAADIRNGIYERTFPAPSPVLFQLLGLLMEAARDIASVNDAITGDAARTAPVGTTLALIEQGQQVFNAIYKRVYRSLRQEFQKFTDLIRRYGDPEEYAEFLDEEDLAEALGMMGHNGGPPMEQDPQALAGMIQQQPAPQITAEQLFKVDFAEDDLDIRPVSDPSAVTKMQSLAKDQFALSFLGKGIYADDRAVVRATLQDAGIEQAEDWIPEQPPQPDPVTLAGLQAKIGEMQARIAKLQADAQLSTARAAEIAHKNTGAQADANLAEQAARTQEKLANAAATAAGLVPGLIDGGGPAPTAAPPAPEYP